MVIGFLGVVVTIGPELLKSRGLEGLGRDFSAELAILAATLSYAFASIYGRRFKRMDVAPLVTATGQVTVSSLLLLPVVLIVDRPWTLAVPSLPALLSILGIAGLSTALAYGLYFRILATAGATNIALVTFLIPVSAIGLGCFILGERIDAGSFLGMGLIGIGLAIMDGRPLRLALQALAGTEDKARSGQGSLAQSVRTASRPPG